MGMHSKGIMIEGLDRCISMLMVDVEQVHNGTVLAVPQLAHPQKRRTESGVDVYYQPCQIVLVEDYPGAVDMTAVYTCVHGKSGYVALHLLLQMRGGAQGLVLAVVEPHDSCLQQSSSSVMHPALLL